MAIIYWLTSIKKVSKDSVLISSEYRTDFSVLYQLPADELFTLAAVIQHDTLNAKDHAIIFSQDTKDSSRTLNLMRTRGLLVQTGDYFSIHPFLYRPVIKALEIKNILH